MDVEDDIKSFKEDKLINNNEISSQSNKLNQLTIIYSIPKSKTKNKIKLFGSAFVKNNKKNCYLLIDGRKRELCATLEKYEFNAKNGKKLVGFPPIAKMYFENLIEVNHKYSASNLYL